MPLHMIPSHPFFRSLMRASALSLLLGSSACGSEPENQGEESKPRRCNGAQELCERRVNEVVFPATHNSMSNSDEGWVAPNQVHGLEQQLSDGIRGFLLDTHLDLDTPKLCHSNCKLGERDLVDALSAFTKFLKENKHEVLFFILEDYVPAAIAEAAFQESGLEQYVYRYDYRASPRPAWPTLNELIELDQRLIVTTQNGEPPPSWYHPFWELGWDSPYSFSNVSEFNCDENRGSRSHELFLLNHWVESPLATQALSTEANTYEALMKRVSACRDEVPHLPNLIAVNHYSIGDLFRVVNELNQVE